MPNPKAGEVLVKMEFAPINPSDLSAITGTYNSAQREVHIHAALSLKICESSCSSSCLCYVMLLIESQELPCQLGFEGSGTVVQSGGGLLGFRVMGKRVACVSKAGGECVACDRA